MINTGLKILIIVFIVTVVIGVVGTVSFGWTLNTSPYLATLSTIFAIIFYILPIKQLAPIITIFISSIVFRLAIAIIKSLWQLLPIGG